MEDSDYDRTIEDFLVMEIINFPEVFEMTVSVDGRIRTMYRGHWIEDCWIYRGSSEVQ